MSKTNDTSKSILSQWNALKKVEPQSNATPAFDKTNHIASEGQQRLFFLNELHGDNPVYNLTEIWNVHGDFDASLFLKAFDFVGQRQAILRTTFHLENGQITCRVQDDFLYNYEFIDLSHLSAEAQENQAKSVGRQVAEMIFDLATGPLICLRICKLKNDSFRLIINMHHIITDKWSMRLLRGELSLAYQSLLRNAAVNLPALSHQFSDYAIHQLNSQVDPVLLAYWKKKLADAASHTTLPHDQPAFRNISLKGKYTTNKWPLSFYNRIKSFCRDQKITPFIFFLSLFKILIHKYTNEDDILVGTPISTRSKLEYEKIVGFFNDTIVLRTDVHAQMTFLNVLSKTKQTVLEAFENKEIGFQNLLQEMKPNRSIHENPFFQLMFLYHQEFPESSFADHLKIDVENYDMGVSKFDLTLYVAETPNAFELTIEYATDLFSEPFIQRLLHHVKELADQVLTDAQVSIQNLSCINTQEIKELLRVGKGPDMVLDEDLYIVDAIFQNADPERIALQDEEQAVSYEMLNLRSNQIANELLERRLKTKTIGILLSQSADFVFAMIGVLKAGCAYVPLDISYPAPYIQHVLKESEIDLILSANEIDTSHYKDFQIINLEEIQASSQLDRKRIGGTSTAYIMFTSGSTGDPNGVVVSHKNLLNSTRARFSFYDDQPTSFLLLSSFSFDSSVAGIYWTLLNGGKLVIPKKESIQDVEAISQLIDSEKISHTLLIPSLYQVFLDYLDRVQLEQLKVVILAGEVLPVSVAELHLSKCPSVKLYNEYGPTEATVWVCAFEIKAFPESKTIPIGVPIANTMLLILDEQLNMTPKGIPGILYVGGSSVSSGYLKSEEPNNKKFIRKIIDGSEYLLYRTGDWAKWDQNNNLIFLGRRDHQVKVRGYRIELGKIDATIRSYDQELQSATVYIPDQNELVSCIISKNGLHRGDLSAYLRTELPSHFCPDKIIEVKRFPLLPNGKVDFKALAQMAHHEKSRSKGDIEISPQQAKHLAIWREILNNSELGIHDNFFESGGDSIQIIRIIAKSRKEGMRLSPKDIYTHQNIATLTQFTASSEVTEISNFIWDKLPVSPIQSWFFEAHQANPHHWLQGYAFKLKKPISVETFKHALVSLINQYEIFHVCFTKEYNKWFHYKKTFQVSEFIKFQQPGEDSEVDINMIKGPLSQFILTEQGGLISGGKIIMHHLIMDALSWDVLFSFLENQLSGAPAFPKRIKLDYFTWINRLSQLASTNVFDGSLKYWNDTLKFKSKFFANARVSREQNTHTIYRKIDTIKAQAIKDEAKKYSRLKMDEVIIASFLQVFWDRTNELALTVMLERHGRDFPEEEIDLSDSIGWHTTYFPVHFMLSNPSDTLDALIDVKEQLRRVPDNGRSYGALKYLTEKIPAHPHTFVVINHLGDSLSRKSEIFEEMEFMRAGMRDENSERDYLIEINSWFENNELHIALSYDQVQLDGNEMSAWCDDLLLRLSGLPEILNNQYSVQTPSDFDFSFDHDDLATILKHKKVVDVQIKDVIELTATQSALLFHHLYHQTDDQGLIVASANFHGHTDKSKLQKAWNTLVERHDVLRSFFIWENLTKPAQIISKRIDYELKFVECEQLGGQTMDQVVQSWVAEKSNITLTLNSPPIYRLVCFEQNGSIKKIVFVCHHIYLDGWSTSHLFDELIKIYRALILEEKMVLYPVPTLGRWKEAFNNTRDDGGTSFFWESYLSGVKPTYLKRYSTLQASNFNTHTFSIDRTNTSRLLANLKESRVTLNTFFVGAWGWLLSRYLDRNEVVIGLTHSGRSLQLDHMDQLIGMFSCVLPTRYTGNKINEIDFLETQHDLNEILTKDAVSLEDISLASMNQQDILFDTLLIIENFISNAAEHAESDVYLSDFKSQISSTIPLCIVVIPGDELHITLRYNSNVYESNEIQRIGTDLIDLATGLKIRKGHSIISFEPKYKVDFHKLENSAVVERSGHRQEDWKGDENKILSIWREVLSKNDLQLDDNFFHIGGTSLLAVRIFNRINDELGINASPILLLKHHTARELSKNLVQKSVLESWKCLYPLNQNGDLQPLFCFHAGDGHIMFYKELAEYIRPERPVYGIQPVGLDGSEMHFSSISEMADYYIAEIKKEYPDGPYHLLGTCFSNAVTFEIAKKLKSEIGHVFIVDSPPPFYNELSKLKKWMHWVFTFNVKKLSKAFMDYFKYSKLRQPSQTQDKNLFLTGKHLRHIMSRYKWSPLDIEIILIRSRQNDEDQYKSYHILNWKKLAKRGLTIKTISGNHQNIFQGYSAREMATITDSLIDRDGN